MYSSHREQTHTDGESSGLVYFLTLSAHTLAVSPYQYPIQHKYTSALTVCPCRAGPPTRLGSPVRRMHLRAPPLAMARQTRTTFR